ncbi:MAG: Phosphoglycerate mutase [Actinomycetia bacterium]|nr:Phosphoglycerate mutase [Actinomycetes bacterium]
MTAHTTLFLARHGETVWHAENRYAGISDVALNDRGREQAAQLASWAMGSELDAVWASPLGRARATAAPAATALGLPITVDAGLIEVGFGMAEGRTLAELPPDRVAAFRADPVGSAFPGADDPRAAAGRGVEALRRIAAQHPGARVLVVTHNTLLRLVLCELLGIPLSCYRRVFPQVRNGATTEIRLDGADAALIAYNTPLPSAGEQVEGDRGRPRL